MAGGPNPLPKRHDPCVEHAPTELDRIDPRMNNKRILLVHSDRLLLRLYREKLEESGFAVEATGDLDQAVKIWESRKPGVVLLNLVFQNGDALEFVVSLRRQPGAATVPILILPTALTDLGAAAVEMGATKVIDAGESPIASIINAVKVSLGMGDLGSAVNAELFKPDSYWQNAVLSHAIEPVNQMRHCLPGICSTPPEMDALRRLWAFVHGFAEEATLLPFKPLARFTAALDLLLRDLNEAPEQLNASTLRTIGQAIDFLAQISNPACLQRLTDPAFARILAVDDEPSALDCISAALQLAGLPCETATAPSGSLEKLGHHPCDLIFLDIGMPQVDGFALCTKIRGLPAHKTTPIVFITGLTTFHNKATACLSGGNDFVGKPFNLPELGVKALTWLYRGQIEAA